MAEFLINLLLVKDSANFFVENNPGWDDSLITGDADAGTRRPQNWVRTLRIYCRLLLHFLFTPFYGSLFLCQYSYYHKVFTQISCTPTLGMCNHLKINKIQSVGNFYIIKFPTFSLSLLMLWDSIPLFCGGNASPRRHSHRASGEYVGSRSVACSQMMLKRGYVAPELGERFLEFDGFCLSAYAIIFCAYGRTQTMLHIPCVTYWLSILNVGCSVSSYWLCHRTPGGERSYTGRWTHIHWALYARTLGVVRRMNGRVRMVGCSFVNGMTIE